MFQKEKKFMVTNNSKRTPLTASTDTLIDIFLALILINLDPMMQLKQSASWLKTIHMKQVLLRFLEPNG